MSSILAGDRIRVSVFGQSHSEAIGAVVDGLPAGFQIDFDKLKAFTSRRAPGQASYATARKEADEPVFLSGLCGDTTCGAPLGFTIANTNTRSGDYANLRETPRPSHADYAAHVKFRGFQDVAGGGHFSGRLTAPLCVAGGICLQMLASRGVQVRAHIYAIADVCDTSFDPVDIPDVDLGAKPFPVLSDKQGEKMRAAIERARMDCDSVGGVVECAVTGVPAGLGDPMFDGVENRLAKALFGIPAVKGLEFGSGFAGSGLRGSENNDAFLTDGQGHVTTATNRHGGILGGITSGMPVVFRAAFKPTASIAKPQQSVHLPTDSPQTLVIKGRHDPCIVPRAVPVVEAVTALVMLDLLLGGEETWK